MKCELKGGAQALNLWRQWGRWRKPLGPAALGTESHVPWPCPPAFSSMSSCHLLPTALTHCPAPHQEAPQKPRRLAPVCTEIRKGPERGSGLMQATQQAGQRQSWPEDASCGLATVPAPVFPGSPQPLLSCGGHNDFIFLPLSLSCSAASSSVYALPLGKEKSETQLGRTMHLRDPI